jgi:hypothetical protein
MEVAGSREFVSIVLPGAKSPEPLRFHVDTGGNTPGLMISSSAAAHLGFTTADSLPRTIRVGDRDIALPAKTSWIIDDDSGPEAQLDRQTRKGFAVGQIGAGFLSRFVVCVDPGHGRLGLGDPQTFDLDAGDAKSVPLFFIPGGENQALYPFVHVLLVEGGAFVGGYGLLLDTGATTSMLDRNKIDFQRSGHKTWPTANGAFGDADMIGGRWAEAVLRAPDVALHQPAQNGTQIDLGPARFVDRPTGTWSRMFGDVRETMGSHGAIANDVLLGYRLLIDYPHGRLFVEASPRAPDASAASSRVGLALRFGADGCPEVRQVTDTNAKATRDKVQVGDVLVAVDALDACKAWHHEISAALAGPPGTKKKLRLKRGAAVVDVEVPTSELLLSPGSP